MIFDHLPSFTAVEIRRIQSWVQAPIYQNNKTNIKLQKPYKQSTCLHALAALTPPLKDAQALAPAAKTSTDSLIASSHYLAYIQPLHCLSSLAISTKTAMTRRPTRDTTSTFCDGLESCFHACMERSFCMLFFFRVETANAKFLMSQRRDTNLLLARKANLRVDILDTLMTYYDEFMSSTPVILS
ncbi:hypothetical protein DID88_003865 [Monilinia fructigena]|uniref:Uncharacterized protein n=1 Tax=Monilinia fructigena TaxID=38457 RepID=A0A395IT17_9HELO|nr:hypothetical protein DID88_003865 [Monilinia fructigena]